MGLGPPELGEGCDSDVALPLHEASLSIASTSFRGPSGDWPAGARFTQSGVTAMLLADEVSGDQ
jgi:hypothetical protein